MTRKMFLGLFWDSLDEGVAPWDMVDQQTCYYDVESEKLDRYFEQIWFKLCGDKI